MCCGVMQYVAVCSRWPAPLGCPSSPLQRDNCLCLCIYMCVCVCMCEQHTATRLIYRGLDTHPKGAGNVLLSLSLSLSLSFSPFLSLSSLCLTHPHIRCVAEECVPTSTISRTSAGVILRCSVLSMWQYVAVCCSVLQCVADECVPTSTMSRTSAGVILPSFMTAFTVSIHLRKKRSLSDSNLARERAMDKSSPSYLVDIPKRNQVLDRFVEPMGPDFLRLLRIWQEKGRRTPSSHQSIICIHTHSLSLSHTHTHLHTHTYAHARAHRHINRHKRTMNRSQRSSEWWSRHTHTHTHTYTRTHIHTHTHTHAHKRTIKRS